MTLWFRKTQKKEFFWHFFVRTYVCMSRPKSLNISRSPNARALILVSKHFYIWGIDAIKIFSELVGRFWSHPHFSRFWNFEKFQFFGIILSREPFEIRWWGKICLFRLCWIIWWPRWDTLILPGEKVTTHDNKTFVGFCFDPMVITVVGWEISFLFLNNFCSTQLIYLKFYVWGFLGVPYWIMMWKC